MSSGPKFYTKSGWLTAYAHACGYLHITKLPCGAEITLGENNIELNAFEIRTRGVTPRIWDVVEGLPAARRRYKELWHELSAPIRQRRRLARPFRISGDKVRSTGGPAEPLRLAPYLAGRTAPQTESE